MGKDLSGVVAAVGSSVSKFKIGDEVFGMHSLANLGAGKVYLTYLV
jgi:NADPH:quinone reductase-like Zn-dependent oxidoreductase